MTSQAAQEGGSVPSIGHRNTPISLGKEVTIIFPCGEDSGVVGGALYPSDSIISQTEGSLVPAASRDSVEKLTLMLTCSGLRRCICIFVLSFLATGVHYVASKCIRSRLYNVFFFLSHHTGRVSPAVIKGCLLKKCLCVCMWTYPYAAA